KVKVKFLGADERGKIRLSMKVVDQETGEDISEKIKAERAERGEPEEREERGDRPPRRDRDDRGGGRGRERGGFRDRGPREDRPREERAERPARDGFPGEGEPASNRSEPVDAGE
ncbi:hypothetical protein, partial [uncultured Enterovirga sp.]|uniref:hypothetical protein n=1 Tax=uncultured Enterovirga sp. TaxID=2026352 RepID=UPI0035CA695E